MYYGNFIQNPFVMLSILKMNPNVMLSPFTKEEKDTQCTICYAYAFAVPRSQIDNQSSPKKHDYQVEPFSLKLKNLPSVEY